MWILIGALACLVLPQGCRDVQGPSLQPASEDDVICSALLSVDAAEASAVENAHMTQEWRQMEETLAVARAYYAVKRSWGNPADKSDDDDMEAQLAEAEQAIDRLLADGSLAEPEAELLRVDIRREHWGRYHRSRNVVEQRAEGMMSETHMDGGGPAGPLSIKFELGEKLPLVEALSELRGRNPVVTATVLSTIEQDLQTLGWNRDADGPGVGIEELLDAIRLYAFTGFGK